MPAPKEILELVRRFDDHKEAYKSGQYNETQLRREFLDPFFKALGWDIDNTQGTAEQYKDVIHEDSIKIGGNTKAPDYCFRIGGTRKFFLEAKKPSVFIKEEIPPAYQLRRYAWSAKLPLSVLSDFEEFAIYDCRIRPQQDDKASTARVYYCTYDQYAEKWDEIASIFSKDAVLKGSFDKYAETNKKKKGTAEVDDVFLNEIESWREHLAQNIALRNPELSQAALNYSVQQTIDRIIFLRICEDRGIEPYGQLQALQNGANIYVRLREIFHRADDRYNSGLFHFSEEKDRHEPPDRLTLGLHIDDKPLKEIFKHLYYPDSPYEFSVLGADILGSVYEQFLGKVIRLTPEHRAVVEDKPEVKKAGGVYYTPTYIVDYIVKQTVGKLVEGKKPKDVEKLRILDPACGSGSFLIGAYQYLMDWHLKWYEANEPEKHAKGRPPRVYRAAGGVWRLTTNERRRILLNNIYGVDIDTQAVEVTKLSLLLKVLEGESDQSLNTQMALFRERALPDLGENIKCGNSLISPDFYEGQLIHTLDDEERRRINVFDWNEGFPEIMQAGGFDGVIGNPPWISLSGKFGAEVYSKEEIDFLIKTFEGNTYMPNMYEYFVAQGIALTRNNGFFSFVVPDRLGFNNQFVPLRKNILTKTQVISLLYKVPFPGVTADTLIFVLRKGEWSKDHVINISEYGKQDVWRLQNELLEHPNYAFEYFVNDEIMHLISKIGAGSRVVALGSLCETTSGFGGKSSLIHEDKTDPKQIPVLKGDCIGRYEIRKNYWFDFRRENITGRTTDTAKLGASPKILLRKTGDSIIATYDGTAMYPEQSLYFLYNKRTDIDFRFLLGVLNSKLLTFYYRAKSLTNKESIAQVKKVDLDQLPMPAIQISNLNDKAKHNRMLAFVESLLTLHRQLVAAKTPHEKDNIQRQINATDKQIDKLVYELYGLTEEEIRIVEEQN